MKMITPEKNGLFHLNESIDKKLFIDYTKMKDVDNFNSENAIYRIHDFMHKAIEDFSLDNRDSLVRNFSFFSEKGYFPKLGYGKTEKGHGNGVPVDNFIEVFDILNKRDMLDEKVLTPEFNIVFIQNYGQDYSSDTIISLILPELSEYTKYWSNKKNYVSTQIPADYWNTEKQCWDKMQVTVVNTNENDPNDYRLFCPEDILASKLKYSMDDFIYRYCREIHNAKLHNDEKKKLTRDEFHDYIYENYEDNYKYLLFVLGDMDRSQLLGYTNHLLR